MAGAGVDMAIWDALAVAAGQPLVRLLGGEPRTILAYNSNGLGLIEPQAAADEALQLLEGGFQGVKMRLGRTTAAADLAAVRAVRQALPANVALMADFNQALTLREALHRGHLLDGEGLAWIEEPIRHDDYAGYAELQRQLTTPIQLGENFAGPKAMAAAIAAGAVGYAMPDAERIGGVSGWMDASALASAHEIELSSHLFPEVSAHLLAASPMARWLEYVDWAAPLLQKPMQLQSGMATPSLAAGTGLAWDPEAVARFRVD
jgi:mandelate racemase